MSSVSSVASPSRPVPNRPRPEVIAFAKRLLKAGNRLRFSIVDDDGTKRRSHEIELRGRRYFVMGMEGEPLGSFLSFGAAHQAGFAASAETLQHGHE